MDHEFVIDKDGGLKRVKVEMSPVEALVMLDALRMYADSIKVHPQDAMTARKMRGIMLNIKVKEELK